MIECLIEQQWPTTAVLSDHTATKLRSCLTLEHVNMLIFLNQNAFYTV